MQVPVIKLIPINTHEYALSIVIKTFRNFSLKMPQKCKIGSLFDLHSQKIHISPVISSLVANQSEECLKLAPITKPLNLQEKKFLLAVERGDLTTVKRTLVENGRTHRKQFDPNCNDSLGRNAIHLAIDGENLEMLELLIAKGVESKDALLHAINLEFVEAVEMLLENENNSSKEDNDFTWQKVDPNIAAFTPDITPLILAAHRNNYEILKLLLDKGAILPMPHEIKCGCDECIKGTKEDSLRHSLSRVNEYRALASPSLIALSSCDPILTAFELSCELGKLAFAEPECKSAYIDLRRQCEKFAVDLLQQSRGSQELAIILNHDPNKVPCKDQGDRMRLTRLRLAIEFRQKEFVAHPHIQQLLASIWYEGVPGFRRKSTFTKTLIISKVALFFPIYCLLYLVFPNSKYGSIAKKPFMKFLVHASAYMAFLVVLVLASQRTEFQIIEYFSSESIEDFGKTNEAHRGNLPTFLECIILFYIVGFIYEESKEIYNVGITCYLENLWNIIEFFRNFFYILVIIFRIAAYVQQTNEIQQDPKMATMARENWYPYDPQLVSEGFFAAANVFSALKLIYLFSINPYLGPLQISLGRMIIDIVKFCFIFTLVLFSFACGLNQLLWYYSDLERKKCFPGNTELPDWKNNPESCSKWRLFANVFESSQSLFWASFGMINIDSFELEGIKSYTRFWGLLMFGCYCVINTIVVVNLLIAMMSNSYALIECHSDKEWKFARTKLWISYFDEIPTLPPPFNIIPGIKCLRRLKRARKCKDTTLLNQSYEEDCSRYANVMRALVWRYVSMMNRKCEENSVTEDDVNEIKNEISAFRYEMLEILKRNGMDVSSAQREKSASGKRMKVWERRLMRDFKVAPANSEDVAVEDSPTMGKETGLSRFKRIAKLALLHQSNLNKRESSEDGPLDHQTSTSSSRNISCDINESSTSFDSTNSGLFKNISSKNGKNGGQKRDVKALRAQFFRSMGKKHKKHAYI